MLRKPNTSGIYAAIYVRTSSEHQGEKASPDEQEADCRRLADEMGLKVVAVYRDIERYRVRSRMVDPSGTRADRPGLHAMLQDAASQRFDTILAWREDRLYRGMRAMLIVLDAIQEHKVNVMLARESFDPKMAPIKAWVAQMELDGMRERMSMGVKARLRAGNANTGQDRYGYVRKGTVIEIHEEEAYWVQQIFNWYLEGVKLMEIRERLIQAGAPQKGSSVPRKYPWARSSIQSILGAAYEYAYGIKIQTRDGEKFEIPIPPIIDQPTFQRFIETRQSKKTFPQTNVKREYLLSGLIHCSCGRTWSCRTPAAKFRKNRRGETVPRKSFNGVYYCSQFHREAIHPDCPRTIGYVNADKFVWNEICRVLEHPETLIAGVNRYLHELSQQSEQLYQERERFRGELAEIVNERQWVITQARKGRISEEDMENQLGALQMQETYLKRELVQLGDLLDFQPLAGWEEKARIYLEDMRQALEWLNAAPQDDEERREQFAEKKRIIRLLVDHVQVDRNRDLKVVYRVNVLELLRQQPAVDQLAQVGTYTRTPATLFHPHPGAGGG
jgi:site-specific DNA recombinase